MKRQLAFAIGGCLCAAAHAQSSVTLYGLIDNGISYVSNQRGHSAVLASTGNIVGDRWGLTGSEDLGGGLKAIFKDFNYAGDRLVTRLKEFRKHGVHILGSFIFGLPTDKEDTFGATAELAQRADIAFAQFIMLTPFPGTVDFAKWEEKMASDPTRIAGYPLTRFWLIPREQRPKVYTPHPMLSPEQIRAGTQSTWDTFYSIPAIWERASIIKSIKGRLLFVMISKLYRQMYANTGIATDSARVTRSAQWARVLAKQCRRLFIASPMPDLQVPN